MQYSNHYKVQHTLSNEKELMFFKFWYKFKEESEIDSKIYLGKIIKKWRKTRTKIKKQQKDFAEDIKNM